MRIFSGPSAQQLLLEHWSSNKYGVASEPNCEWLPHLLVQIPSDVSFEYSVLVLCQGFRKSTLRRLFVRRGGPPRFSYVYYVSSLRPTCALFQAIPTILFDSFSDRQLMYALLSIHNCA